MLNGGHSNYGSFETSPQTLEDQSVAAASTDLAAAAAAASVCDRSSGMDRETYLQSRPLLHDEWRPAQHTHPASLSRHARRFTDSTGSSISTPSTRSPGVASAVAPSAASVGGAVISGPPTPIAKGFRYMANGSAVTSPSNNTDTTMCTSPHSTNTSGVSTGATGSLYGSNMADNSGASGTPGAHLLNGTAGPPDPNGLIRLEVGEILPPRFPPEKLKTLVAFIWMVMNFLLTLTSLALTHERVPEVRPLPDIVLDNVPTFDWALSVSEAIILVLVYSAFIAVILHRHRMIVLRRIFMIMGLLYMMRSVTYFVTVLPKPNPHYHCAPKAGANLTAGLVVGRVLKLLTGLGLSINGQHVYCGDYIYSGHTVTLTMAYLVIREYTPRHWWPLHWCSMLFAVTGVVMLLLSRGHYTVDVLVAYFVSSRVFWIYHVMANNNFLKERGGNNFLSRLWWHRAFRYLEGNVSAPLPRHYQWPLSWPRCFLSKRPERIS